MLKLSYTQCIGTYVLPLHQFGMEQSFIQGVAWLSPKHTDLTMWNCGFQPFLCHKAANLMLAAFCTSLYSKQIISSLNSIQTYSEDTFRFAEHQKLLDLKRCRVQNNLQWYLYSETKRASVLLINNFACNFSSAGIFYFIVQTEDIFLAIKMPESCCLECVLEPCDNHLMHTHYYLLHALLKQLSLFQTRCYLQLVIINSE